MWPQGSMWHLHEQTMKLLLPVKNCAISSFEHSKGSPLSRTTASLPRSGGCPILLQIHSISPLLDSNTSTYLLPMKLLLFARALWRNKSTSQIRLTMSHHITLNVILAGFCPHILEFHNRTQNNNTESLFNWIKTSCNKSKSISRQKKTLCNSNH